MRPHTWSKAKPLVSVAGKTALDYLMEMFQSLPTARKFEFVFIVGPYLGETQLPPVIAEHYPDIKAHFVVQAEMKGQSHALFLARQYLTGPMIMCFSDTLIETDFSFLEREKSDGVAWVKEIEDPRRFGVAEVNPDGWITRLIEKPTSVENNLALVGCYYFKMGENLISAIEEQMERGTQLNDEYFLVDAINIMLENHALMRVEKIKVWFDTGTIDATLETNRYLLQREQGKTKNKVRPSVRIIEPVFIHDTAEIRDSTIGPFASIGAQCSIQGSSIEDSILEADCVIRDAALKGSIIGRKSRIEGKQRTPILTLNVGENSSVISGEGT